MTLGVAAEPVSVVYDTDLGSDVDDAIALAFLATDPRCRLLAVTTVNGDTRRRAALARALLDLAGRADVPIGIGASHPLSGQPGKNMPYPIVADGPIADLPVDMPTAAEVIVDAVRNADDRVHICGVGAYTNLATVLAAHPELLEHIATIHLMGGCLRPFSLVPGGRRFPVKPDHNVNGDPIAAAVCLSLPLPVRLVPQDVTNHLILTDEDRIAIAASGPLGEALDSQMAGWLRYVATRTTDPDAVHVRLHDPLTVIGTVATSVEQRAELPLSVTGTIGSSLIVQSPVGRLASVVVAADHDRLRTELLGSIARLPVPNRQE